MENEKKKRKVVKDEKARKMARESLRYKKMGSKLFIAVLFVLAVIGLMFFVRPKHSDLEKRDLAEFPKFTMSSFMDGTFFKELSVWYSDTFPMRDKLVSGNEKMKLAYGVQSKTQMIGGDEQGDEIPDIPDVPVTQPVLSPQAATSIPTGSAQPTADPSLTGEPGGNPTGEPTGEATGEPTNEPTAEPTDEATPTPTPVTNPSYEKVDVPPAGPIDAGVKEAIMNNLYIENGAAYALYYFGKAASDHYTSILENAAKRLAGTTNVYSILVPNNTAIVLPDSTIKQLGVSDEKKAIQYFYACMPSVHCVPTYDILREHNSEYLYFRTDHHWTVMGAYYVYQNFCAMKGVNYIPLSEKKEMKFEGFLGSYYSNHQYAGMAENPDTVYAYVPKGTNDMTYVDDKSGKTINWKVVMDVSNWNRGSYYNTFVAGDQKYAVCKNPAVTDGSSCVIVKESYGNPLSSLLVDHYSTTYMFDVRYTDVDVFDFCKKNNITDLIIVNNIQLAGSQRIRERLETLLGKP